MALLAAVLGTSPDPASAELLPGGTFVDDDGTTHEGAIEAIVAESITSGCDAGGLRYCPNNPVTRGQMATFLTRALELPPASTDHFADDNGTTHEDAINRIADAGITTGDRSGRYNAGRSVARGQMATFLARALRLPPASRDHFADDNGTTHEDGINRVAEAAIASGVADGSYGYLDPVRRGQMATFLARALDLTITVPPSRALAHGPGALAAMLTDLNDGGSLPTAASITTGIARQYIGYVFTLYEVFGDIGTGTWREISPATSATNLGNSRFRLNGLVVEWNRDGGITDRISDVVVRIDRTNGRVTVDDYWRSGVPLNWIIRSPGTVSESRGVVAHLEYNFQDVSYNQAPLIATVRIQNRMNYPIAIDGGLLARDDGHSYYDEGFETPIIDPGGTGVAVLAWSAVDLVAHGGTIPMIAYGFTEGDEAEHYLDPRIPAWPR